VDRQSNGEFNIYSLNHTGKWYLESAFGDYESSSDLAVIKRKALLALKREYPDAT